MKQLIEFEVETLKDDEMVHINGGESLWYWIAYGVGQTVRGIGVFADGASAGSQQNGGVFFK